MPRAILHTPGGAAALTSHSGAADVLRALEYHAQAAPGRTAIAEVRNDGHPGHGLTFAQLAARASDLAHTIAATTPPGSVVMLIGPSGPELAVWLLASLMAEVLAFPVTPQSTHGEIVDLARRSGAATVVAEIAAARMEGPSKWIDWSLAAYEPDRARMPPAGRGPGAIVLHSSGTVGVSKLAVREMAALTADAANVVSAVGLTADDCVLLTTPLNHSYGVDLLLGSLVSGASLHTTRMFDPAAIATHLSAHATVFPGVPFVLDAIARLGPNGAASRLRSVFSAGAPLPEAVRASFETSWAIRVGDVYGASELGTVTFNDPASPAYRHGSVGPGLDGVDIRILDPDDVARELPIGHEGHIAISAPSMLSRYLDGEVPMAGSRLLTGDLGRLDEGGRLCLTGRLKLLIDAGGIKVNPLELEAVLRLHAGVADCVVVPLPISGTISRLRAVFTARDPLHAPSPAELREFMAQRVSAARIPRVFDCVPSLPRTPTGKILRAAVAKGFA
jgi:acyl-CoA synthetase (AMP-forming)/AMP-acid ligase II